MNIVPPPKRCTKCQQEYPATTEYFVPEKRSRSGVSSICRICKRKYMQEYSHRPEVRAHKRIVDAEYRKLHIEEMREYDRQYSASHRNEKRAYMREYAQRPEVKERVRIYQRQYYRNADSRLKRREYGHRDEVKLRRRLYHQSPKGKASAKAGKQKRRAFEHSSNGTIAATDVYQQYVAQKGCCWHCGKHLAEKYHVDHLIPLSRGGENSPRNIVISCPECNLSKGAKMPYEWNGRLF